MRRPLTIGAVLALLAAVLASIVSGSTPGALAAPTAPTQSATGWSGSGTADLLEVDANVPAVDPAHVILSPVASAVNADTTPNSVADAANLDAGLLDDSVELDPILTQVHQEAPPDNAEPTEETLLEIPASPLLDLGASTSRAHARWLENGECLASGVPITTAYNETAGADVISAGDFPVVTVTAPEGGVSATQNSIWLTGDGNIRGLTSESYTQVDGIRLLEGTPLGLEISVVDVPTITATADGTAGGASTSHNLEDIVTITALEGSELLPLEDLGTALNDVLIQVLRDLVGEVVFDTVLQPALDALGDPIVVEYDVGADTVVESAAADGTAASIEASVLRLHLTVLPVDNTNPLLEPLAAALAEIGLTDIEANVDLGHMTAAVIVPEGGIDCTPPLTDNPLRDLHKDVSQAEVPPGGQFDYTLTIPNRGPCDLTDVVVTDTIVSPPGTEITADPAADSVDGDTLTWNIGDLAVNETVTITVTVQVPDDAPDGFVFSDTLSAAGDCDGTPVDHTVQLDAPEVSDDFSGPCDLGQSNKAASHLEVTPGQTFNYFIHVFNQGAEPCSDISVTDTLDDQVSFVNCTDGCTNSGQEVSWSGLSLPGGSGMTLTITVQAADDASGTLTNTAVIDSPDDPTGPHTVTHDGPDVTDQSVPAPPNPAVRGPQDAGPLPRTGAELPIALGAFGLLALGFLALRRRVSSLA